jgi:hypothetical protein
MIAVTLLPEAMKGTVPIEIIMFMILFFSCLRTAARLGLQTPHSIKTTQASNQTSSH